MAHEVFYQFPQTPGQARRTGARGGKATARNRRLRLDGAAVAVSEPRAGTTPLVLETTAAAIALLDAHYPWLCGAERRASGTVRKSRRLTTVRLC
jgi:hypothetical protein